VTTTDRVLGASATETVNANLACLPDSCKKRGMRNGIYRIEVFWPDANGEGVAIIRDGFLRGVDHDCAYFGEYTRNEGVLVMSLNRVRLTNGVHVSTGNFVSLSGQGSEKEPFLLKGETNGYSISVVTVSGTWIAKIES
jgi:hypothetical protein